MEMEEAKMDIFTSPVRNYPRSNARSRYRRPESGQSRLQRCSYPRKGSTNEKTISPTTFKEKIVFQAIICGGFLAILLFFNIIDSGFTNNVTDWIYRNISFDMLAEENGVGGWVDSILGIFGNDVNDTEHPLPHYEIIHDGTEAGVMPVQIQPLPQANTIDSSRIDESILREIEAMGE